MPPTLSEQLIEHATAISIAAAEGDDARVLETYGLMLPLLSRLHAMPMWVTCASRAVESAQALGDLWSELEASHHRAQARAAIGARDSAIEDLKSVTDRAKLNGLTDIAARSTAVRGQQERERQNYAQAIMLLKEARGLYGGLGDSLGVARTDGDLGNAQDDAGSDELWISYARALDGFIASDEHYSAGRVLYYAAEAAERRNLFGRAAALAYAAATQYQISGRHDLWLQELARGRSLGLRLTEDEAMVLPDWANRAAPPASVMASHSQSPAAESLLFAVMRALELDQDVPHDLMEELQNLEASEKSHLRDISSRIVAGIDGVIGSNPTTLALRNATLILNDPLPPGTVWSEVTATVAPPGYEEILDDYAARVISESPTNPPRPDIVASAVGQTAVAVHLLTLLSNAATVSERLKLVQHGTELLQSTVPGTLLRHNLLRILGSAYRNWPLHPDGQPASIERSVELNELLLHEAQGTTTERESIARLNLANSLMDRHLTDMGPSLQAAHDHLTKIIEDAPNLSAEVQGLAHHSRALVRDGMGTSEPEVLSDLLQAQILVPLTHPAGAGLYLSLGYHYLRSASGDPALQVQVAIEYLRTALEFVDADGRAGVLNALATALVEESDRDPFDSIAEALACQCEAARLHFQAEDWLEVAGSLNDLSISILAGIRRGVIPAKSGHRLARRTVERSLLLRSGHIAESQSWHNLAAVYVSLQNDGMAETCYRTALRLREQTGSPIWVAESRLELARLLGRRKRSDEILELAGGVQEELLPPSSIILWHGILGRAHADLGDWQAASDCFERALRWQEDQYRQSSLSQTRTSLLSENSSLVGLAASALVNGGRAAEAAVYMERSRARAVGDFAQRGREAYGELVSAHPEMAEKFQKMLLETSEWEMGSSSVVSEVSLSPVAGFRGGAAESGRMPSLGGGEGRRIRRIGRQFDDMCEQIRQLDGLGDFMTPVDWQDIVDAASQVGDAVCYVAVCDLAMVVVIVDGSGAFGHVWPDMNIHRLVDVLVVQPPHAIALLQAADDLSVLEMAATSAYEYAHTIATSILAEMEFEQGSRLGVVPLGLLGRLPVTAALNDLLYPTASHCAVLSSLRLSVEVDRRPDLPWTVVADSQHDLPGSLHEAEAIRCLRGPSSQVVVGGDARVARIREALTSRGSVHFASHAGFDEERPLLSGLTGSDGTLTALEIARMDERLATTLILSACQTGVYDVGGAPDELLGLLSALLVRGVRQMVVSVWPVPDSSTTILMVRLHLELEGGATLGEGLSRAQAWLRSASVDDMKRFWTGTVGSKALLPSELVGKLGEERPFKHPVHWAGFAAIGPP